MNRTKSAGAILIILLTFVVYIPAIRGGFVWDDDAYVTENPLLTAPDGLKRIWFSTEQQSQYFPLIYTTLRFERMLWDLNPVGYHVVNVFLHSLNALLVWAVLKRLSLPGAWLAAAIWAVHPVNVESVAWITELKNTESTLFYLLALLAWMKFVDDETTRSWRFYTLALLLQGLALLSKTTACTLPAAMLLVLWLQKKSVSWRRLVQITPFVVISIAMGLLSIWWEAHMGNYVVKEAGFSFSFLTRLLIASRALWFYIGKFVWPAKLSFSYARWEINSHDPLQYMWLIGCIAVAILLWWQRDILGRAPVTAIVFFITALSPLLGFIPLYTFRFTFVADHYQYVASMGLVALAVGAGVTMLQRAGPRFRSFGRLTGAMVMLTLGGLTWQQALAYQSLETLWRDTLAKNPRSSLAHNNLAVVLAQQDRVPEAIEHWKQALQITPEFAEPHYGLGSVLSRVGRLKEAMEQWEQAAQIKTNYAAAQNNLAWFMATGTEFDNPDRAVTLAEQACKLTNNRSAPYLDTLAVAYAAAGRFSEAIATARKAIDLARSAGQTQLASEIETRLQLYRDGHAYRSPRP